MTGIAFSPVFFWVRATPTTRMTVHVYAGESQAKLSFARIASEGVLYHIFSASFIHVFFQPSNDSSFSCLIFPAKYCAKSDPFLNCDRQNTRTCPLSCFSYQNQKIDKGCGTSSSRSTGWIVTLVDFGGGLVNPLVHQQ